MMLKKTYYDELRKFLGDEEQCVFSDGELGRANDELLYEAMRYYARKDEENIQQCLQNGARYRGLFEQFMTKIKPKQYTRIAYAIGEFTGIIKALEKLSVHLSGKEKDRQTLAGLCASRRYVKTILLQVYHTPDIRHKELADKVGIAPNYLNELIKLLEPTGSIDKYAFGKYTYYELTLEGQRYVEENLKENNRDNGRHPYVFKNPEVWEALMQENIEGKLHPFPTDKLLDEDELRAVKVNSVRISKPKGKPVSPSKLIYWDKVNSVGAVGK